MPLLKSKGNMYPWVTHMHTHLGGECPHKCSYCYVNNGFMGTPRPKRYCGPLRLIEEEFKINYDTDDKEWPIEKAKTIFIEHKNDLFAENVPDEFINRIVEHCLKYPDHTYIFQTKNPKRYAKVSLPKNIILGCTIESNRDYPEISKAPSVLERYRIMSFLAGRKFITIEPVLDFDVHILAHWISILRPEFLNLGADSKGNNLPEPTIEKIIDLTYKLHEYGIELREKHNLQRLMKK